MSPLARVATLLAALLGAGLGLFLVLPLGLVVVEWIIFPLALAIGALLAALAAGWLGTWLAGDGTRTRLAAVVATSELSALVLALAMLGLASLRVTLFGPLAGVAAVMSLLLAVAASLATWRARQPARQPQHDGRLTAALLALAVVSVPAVIWLADLAGLAGA